MGECDGVGAVHREVAVSRGVYSARTAPQAALGSRGVFPNCRTFTVTEQIQQAPYEPGPVLTLIEGRRRLKELRITNLFHLPQCALLLKSMDERLQCGVSDTFVLREAFQDLTHRRSPKSPVLFQDASFRFCLPSMWVLRGTYPISRLIGHCGLPIIVVTRNRQPRRKVIK